MSRTIGHDYREHTGYKLYLQELRERKYGKRQVVKALYVAKVLTRIE